MSDIDEFRILLKFAKTSGFESPYSVVVLFNGKEVASAKVKELGDVTALLAYALKEEALAHLFGSG